MDVEIRVDRKQCIGSGQCVHWAPGVFEQDDDAISVVVDPRGEPEEKIVFAVLACPVQAIRLRVGATEVHPDDLRDWTHGIHAADPIVAALEQLSSDHDDLRAVLRALDADDVCARTTAHLRDEERVYSEITALIGPGLVDSFQNDHSAIERALDAVALHPSDRAVADLAAAVDDHIRLEETVLFPAALAALAKRTPAARVV